MNTRTYHQAMLLHEDFEPQDIEEMPEPIIWRDHGEIVILDRETGDITRLYCDAQKDVLE